MTKLKKWELLEETDVSPSSWFPVVKHKVKLPNGKVVDDFYIAKLGDVAMILAFTPNNQLIFVKQYKHGFGDIITELPAGFVKENKTPEQTVIEELEEETGFVTKKVESLGTLITSPTKSTQKIFVFLAKDVVVQTKQKFDENEDIEVVLIPTSSINEKIVIHEINASDTLAAIILAKAHFPELFS